ncbi:MAG: DEAD/DEAH box helicase family protein [Paludibacteraceae bacterium]|nr:DEAD/DEAH box helicase family protein [Paludibacteraceae bacterium]
MNESDTRLHKIDPALKASGWGSGDSLIKTEFKISNGRISATVKPMPKKADYILIHKGVKLAVVEAKSDEVGYAEGVMQAKEYAKKLCIRFTYATDGDNIYAIDMSTGEEELIDKFPTPDELWNMTYGDVDEWRDKFNAQPLYLTEGRNPRYYQEIAINKTLEAIAKGKNRVLLTLATGTGKTFIAFQISYKLFETKWNVKKTGNRPRILFLTDRNILANQGFSGFFGFKQDALVRIDPKSIRKDGKVPTNGSVFFTIFQTFLTKNGEDVNYGQYNKDFFDLIIIDECHRGGAKDESNWRKILEYFSDAVQLGLTATPRCDVNADTYAYFGEPVYRYSLRDGIEDGFLTPFRHCKMQSNIDDYIYNPEDEIISGEVEEGRVYTEQDFYNGNIIIKDRDRARVKEFMKYIGLNEKTIVFCSTQNHAAAIRDMINQEAKNLGNTNPYFCVRVTANDGAQGEQYLKEFQDNEKMIPTILTTSQKLSTGVDALNVRDIVLLRPINSMVEFKQIIGRGTRLYEGKNYFTIYDFVKAYEKFNDKNWDGEPVCLKCGNNPCTCESKTHSYNKKNEDTNSSLVEEPEFEYKKPLEIRLSDGSRRNIQHIKTDMFWGADGKPVSTEEFIKSLFGKLPEFFKDSSDLHKQWSHPDTRKALLDKLEEVGFGKDNLIKLRTLINADDSDLLDVLEFIEYNKIPIARKERAEKAEAFKKTLNEKQSAFVDYIVQLYVLSGIDELDTSKLPDLLKLKFGSVPEGISALGGPAEARNTFFGFQERLYE